MSIDAPPPPPPPPPPRDEPVADQVDRPIVDDAAAPRDTDNPSGRPGQTEDSAPLRPATDTAPGQGADATETQGSVPDSPDTSAADPVDQPIVDDATAPVTVQETADPSEDPSKADEGALALGAQETGQLSEEPADTAEAAIATGDGHSAPGSNVVAGDTAVEEADSGAVPDLQGQELDVAQSTAADALVEDPLASTDRTAGDSQPAAGAEAMERWEASEDRILQDNADYFDAEAQRYRELGDHEAARASQEAGDRARALIGDSAQPNSADTSPGPTGDNLYSASTGNQDRASEHDSADLPLPPPPPPGGGNGRGTTADQVSDILEDATDATPEAPPGVDPVNKPIIDNGDAHSETLNQTWDSASDIPHEIYERLGNTPEQREDAVGAMNFPVQYERGPAKQGEQYVAYTHYDWPNDRDQERRAPQAGSFGEILGDSQPLRWASPKGADADDQTIDAVYDIRDAASHHGTGVSVQDIIRPPTLANPVYPIDVSESRALKPEFGKPTPDPASDRWEQRQARDEARNTKVTMTFQPGAQREVIISGTAPQESTLGQPSDHRSDHPSGPDDRFPGGAPQAFFLDYDRTEVTVLLEPVGEMRDMDPSDASMDVFNYPDRNSRPKG
jgi:hypothetical protein